MAVPGSFVGTTAASSRPATHAPSSRSTARLERGRGEPMRRSPCSSATLASASTTMAMSMTPPRSETAKSLMVNAHGSRSSLTSK